MSSRGNPSTVYELYFLTEVKAMRGLGICIGASTLSAVGIRKDDDSRITIESLKITPHNGNPRAAFFNALSDLAPDKHAKIAVTGRKLRQAVNLSTIPEPEAVEQALRHLNGAGDHVNAIVSAGGETFLVYVVGKDGRICSVHTGNKCASGTGEFFIQQLRRLGFSLTEAISLAADESNPYTVSGRCSVFCKSDCTHATNKGVSKKRIIAGLCEMMAFKIMEIIRLVPKDRIMIIGGAAQNDVMIECLSREWGDVIVPKEAAYFEALGSALWALDHDTVPLPVPEELFAKGSVSFSTLPPLSEFAPMVDFRDMERGTACRGDRCIIGLDVGSTTTKAVLLRTNDDRILASVYLRTNGNPVQAARACYAELLHQLGSLESELPIAGLGVTGSGRQIAGLHGMTAGVINEIIAHATGALYFDKSVDTIFEIGGQDAKYTFIKKGVPSDYAMNDACSAGTGSFLEEAARETMGIHMEEIAELAVLGRRPPNFNDQCAAFISSDIKNASHEGMTREDIVAGLVYSICMNYNNRVRGNRPAGNNIFMQGGVCYNRAVPLAMASLTGKRIVVPPEPGLMGAFGVALEIKRRLNLHLMDEETYSLRDLRDRAIEYGKPFVCGGGKEKCGRKCEIAQIKLEGKTYPFGGACNRWYNLRFNIAVDSENGNSVRLHENMVFHHYAPRSHEKTGTGDAAGSKTVGVNKSFLTNTYYPLYHHFFTHLGFPVLTPDDVEREGVDLKGAPFCYPAELSHGYLFNLLRKEPDYLFLPQVKGVCLEEDSRQSITCPLSQGEPYYLSTAFKDHETFGKLSTRGNVLKPVVDFSGGYERAEDAFVTMAAGMGCAKNRARAAFRGAVNVQRKVGGEMRNEGLRFLRELEEQFERQGIVIFGRSYNAFTRDANMGIPQKFSSRGMPVVPFSFLPFEGEESHPDMYWSSGRMILKGARFIRRHPQLFGCYITNFSCGPDSFLLEYFRNIMGPKPFLILELDSHVADAGIETRIEAFLDIIRNYRELEKAAVGKEAIPQERTYRAAYFDYKNQIVADSRGGNYALDDPHVHLVFPSMGRILNEAGAAVFRGMGVRATSLPAAGEVELKLGRGNTSCKECLPLLLSVGGLLRYLQGRPDSNELLVYFMPTASGPCRFGQYSPFIDQLISQRQVEDVALFSLQAENGYRNVKGGNIALKLWPAMVISDIMQEVYSLLLTNALDREHALDIFWKQWQAILQAMEAGATPADMTKIMAAVSAQLRNAPAKRMPSETPTLLLTGEIFVRHDDFSRQFLVDKLAEQGFAVKVSGVCEWIYYTDWCYQRNLAGEKPGLRGRVTMGLRTAWMKRQERMLKGIMADTKFSNCRLEDVERQIDNVRHLINPELTGEAILTIGAAMTEVPHHYCGVIAIGPFGCMPNRLSEAILSSAMSGRSTTEAAAYGKEEKPPLSAGGLPFIAIESDGNPFPQIISAKLDVFLAQAERVHREITLRLRKSA